MKWSRITVEHSCIPSSMLDPIAHIHPANFIKCLLFMRHCSAQILEYSRRLIWKIDLQLHRVLIHPFIYLVYVLGRNAHLWSILRMWTQSYTLGNTQEPFRPKVCTGRVQWVRFWRWRRTLLVTGEWAEEERTLNKYVWIICPGSHVMVDFFYSVMFSVLLVYFRSSDRQH